MCTVSYLPLNESSFILTHNRDEHFSRPIATPPTKHEGSHDSIIYPTDPQGLGTWIAGNQQYTICLLNGGFEKHERLANYRHSRGLVVLDFFTFNSIDDFVRSYNFSNLEPFTLLIISHQPQEIHQIIVTHDEVHHKILAGNKPQIWSSSTLYDQPSKTKRTSWYHNLLKSIPSDSRKAMIDFHKQPNDDNQEEGIKINRDNIIRTVSLTSIYKQENNQIDWYYEDFLQHQIHQLHVIAYT